MDLNFKFQITKKLKNVYSNKNNQKFKSIF